jgi:hypothetical protein
MVPVTWVPWAWSSLAWVSLSTKSYGLTNSTPREVLHLVEALVVLVGDAGVEHGDDDALAVLQPPGGRHVDLVHVPLELVLRVVGKPAHSSSWLSTSSAGSSGETP